MGPALLFSQIIKLTNKMLNGKILNEEAEQRRASELTAVERRTPQSVFWRVPALCG